LFGASAVPKTASVCIGLADDKADVKACESCAAKEKGAYPFSIFFFFFSLSERKACVSLCAVKWFEVWEKALCRTCQYAQLIAQNKAIKVLIAASAWPWRGVAWRGSTFFCVLC
jgi:hypothetical protein